MTYYVCAKCKTWVDCVANKQRVKISSGLIFAADKYECKCGANSFYILPETPMYNALNIEKFTGVIDDELLI